jgi:hypothetical protein
MIYTGEIGKKAVEFTEKYSSVLKILRVWGIYGEK